MRVRVYPDTEAETPRGGSWRISMTWRAKPSTSARRWAVRLDTGTLVFVNTDQLVAE